MVMCAGEGTRLRPLTYTLPKPMVPVANRPVLEYTLLNLKRHGIREVVINLGYQSNVIQSYFGDGSRYGILIHYSPEKNLLGTAGGVKKAENIFRNDSDSDFLVTSGDSLTDINFTSLLRFHRKKRAAATIALKKVESRFEYGVTLLNKKDEITNFIEKPSWGEIYSNRVNTGIYVFQKEILKRIPSGKFYDFGRQLLPQLIRTEKACGFEFKEYWTDIGTLAEYKQAQTIVLNKGIRTRPDAPEVRPNVWVGKNCRMERGVRLHAPCFIGNDCFLGKNAIIGAHTIVGHRSQIGSGSVLSQSILWDGVKVGAGARLDRCIIGKDATVPREVSYHGGAILSLSKDLI
ncbi:MAG: NDP-sugar synthase [Elusimicrobia bacterium]|nr:NDP-sugar synthase [Elusimicrobiota bacterium]